MTFLQWVTNGYGGFCNLYKATPGSFMVPLIHVSKSQSNKHLIWINASPYRTQGKWYKSIHYNKHHMQSIQLASSPYYHKSIEKAREMIQAHIAQQVSHGDGDIARVGWIDWYSVGKPKEGHVLVASSTIFLSACRFQCLLIFGIIILCHCKGVVLANRRLDKFFCFSWIVVYIRTGVIIVP